jgi:hypothetical protein
LSQSLGYYKLKQYKSRFCNECAKLSDQKEEEKLKWLQSTSQMNGGNLNNIRPETSKTFRNKKENIPNAKLMSLKQSEQKTEQAV